MTSRPRKKSITQLPEKRMRRVLSGAVDLEGKATPRERSAIDKARAKIREKNIPVAVDFAEGSTAIGPAHGDAPGHIVRLLDAFGTSSFDFTTTQLCALEWVSRSPGTSLGESAVALNAALAFIGAVQPENELEASLAAQMAGTHSLAMEMLGRARHADLIPKAETYANLAIKLQRTFTAQLEALGRLRGKGQQTARVEHVTVHPGAQAIVGDVHHHPGGTAPVELVGDQSHAARTPAERASLPSPDPFGNGMSIACSEREATLPHARRDKSRPRDR